MSKLRNALLSLAATGNLGKNLVFRRQGKIAIAERPPVSPDANTASQGTQRQKFLDCIDDWNTLTPAEKAVWESNARPHHLTGYQFYMSYCLLLPPTPPPVPQRYEWYDDRNAFVIYGAIIWVAQTFTPQASHDSTSVKLKAWNVAAPLATPVILSIQGVDGAQKPDGVDLVVKTITAGDLGIIQDTWFEFVFLANPTLTALTQYAIVLRSPTAPFLSLRVDSDTLAPAYPRGKYWLSLNSGVAWNDFPLQDLSFEDWGLPV